MASRRVFVVGVGMTKFLKPGRPGNPDYPELVKEAVTAALSDAKVSYQEVEQATVGYVYGESTSGQRALYDVAPLTGIPVYNVNNNCSTGASALLLARNMILAGNNCVLATGFEKMEKGSLQQRWADRASPFEKCMEPTINKYGISAGPFAAQMFGNAAREHMEKYGTTREQLAKIAEKNHRNSANNPNSQFRDIYSLEDVMKSPVVHDPLTKLQCCPTSDGAAAAIVVGEEFVRKRGLEKQAVEILAMEMATDVESSFTGSCISAVGFDMAKKAADQAYRKAGVTAKDVQVIELHDCFSANELITYEALSLCPIGKAGELIDRRDNDYGGKWVVNPSGGLISKGHPLGATGLAQCAELCWQLRNLAGPRQVPNAKVALQHNIGLGGAAVVALYKLGFPEKAGAAKQTSSTATAAGASADGLPSDATSFKAFPVFEELRRALADTTRRAELQRKVSGVVCFKVAKPDGSTVAWIVDLKSSAPSIQWLDGAKAKGDCILTLSDQDLSDLSAGRLMPQKAFFEGRLKISGNMNLATKVQAILQSTDKARL